MKCCCLMKTLKRSDVRMIRFMMPEMMRMMMMSIIIGHDC